jgi:hypothetical protein
MSLDHLFRAKVIDNSDPLHQGRVKVFIPKLMSSESEAYWAYPGNNSFSGGNSSMSDPAQKLSGSSNIPLVGQWVMIEFEGTYNLPYYIRGLNISNQPITYENTQGSQPHNKWVIFRSPSGRSMTISDDPSDDLITITGSKSNPESTYYPQGTQSVIQINESNSQLKTIVQDPSNNYMRLHSFDNAIYNRATSSVTSNTNKDMVAIIDSNDQVVSKTSSTIVNQDKSGINVLSPQNPISMQSGASTVNMNSTSIKINTPTQLNLSSMGQASISGTTVGINSGVSTSLTNLPAQSLSMASVAASQSIQALAPLSNSCCGSIITASPSDFSNGQSIISSYLNPGTSQSNILVTGSSPEPSTLLAPMLQIPETVNQGVTGLTNQYMADIGSVPLIPAALWNVPNDLYYNINSSSTATTNTSNNINIPQYELPNGIPVVSVEPNQTISQVALNSLSNSSVIPNYISNQLNNEIPTITSNIVNGIEECPCQYSELYPTIYNIVFSSINAITNATEMQNLISEETYGPISNSVSNIISQSMSNTGTTLTPNVQTEVLNTMTSTISNQIVSDLNNLMTDPTLATFLSGTITNNIQSTIESDTQNIPNAIPSITNLKNSVTNSLTNISSNMPSTFSTYVSGNTTTPVGTGSMSINSSIPNPTNYVGTVSSNINQTIASSINTATNNSTNNSIINSIRTISSNFSNGVSNLITNTQNDTIGKVQSGMSNLQNDLGSFMSGIGMDASNMTSRLQQPLQNSVGTITNSFQSLSSVLSNSVSKITTGMASNILNVPESDAQSILSNNPASAALSKVSNSLSGLASGVIPFKGNIF